MAPGDVVPEHVKQPKPKPKEKPPAAATSIKLSKVDCESDGSFVFEAHEAWKDFHKSLSHFYEVGEFCDVTLKVRCRSKTKQCINNSNVESNHFQSFK